MNNRNLTFSIKDLENLCGVKAHTIRIWEKRYHLLEPNRTNTNIRAYNIDSLKKLLNVSFLVSCGYKISRISKLSEEDIQEYLNSIISNQTTVDRSLNSLKLAMLNFNTNLLSKTYDELANRLSFSQIFYDVFIPFLNQIGILWQSNTINSTHEHFVANFIKQKLWSQINLLQQNITNTEKTFVLYLPEGEINDLSLLFLNTLILAKGYKTIFLGQNVSLDFLTTLADLQQNLVFISYLTLAPQTDELNDYVSTFRDKICLPNSHELWIMGSALNDTSITVSALIKVIYSFQDFEKIIN